MPKVIWIDNTTPPTNYIWMKLDLKGKLLGVFEYIKNKWTEIDLDYLVGKSYYSRQEIDILLRYVEREILRKIAFGEYDINKIVVDSSLNLLSKNPVRNSVVTEALNGKQDLIRDLAQIRENALHGGAAYIKPGEGIPKEDLEQTIINNLTILEENIDKIDNLNDCYTRDEVNDLISNFITNTVNDLVNYYTKTEIDNKLAGKQDTLVSGENIKTVNGQSILGSGDITCANILYGTTAYWDSQIGFAPDAGTIIVYTDHATKEVNGQIVNIPGIKIGGGNGYVQDLAFIDDNVSASLIEHINNTNIHVSSADRATWDNKINVDDSQEVVNEVLIFNRN